MSYKVFYPTDDIKVESTVFGSGVHSVYVSSKARSLRKIHNFKIEVNGKDVYDIKVDSESRIRVKDLKLKRVEWMKASELYDGLLNMKKLCVELLGPEVIWGKVISMSTSNRVCDKLYVRVLATDLLVPIVGKLGYLVQSTEISSFRPEDINDGDDLCKILSRLQPIKRFRSESIIMNLY